MQSTNHPFSLQNKNIIITGASSGIGRACVMEASKMGANIILIGRNRERLEETVAMTIRSGQHRIISIDLKNHEEVDILIEKLKVEKIKINGLVNAAGISTTLPLKRSSPEKILEFVNTNVVSGVNLSRLIVQKQFLDENGASIIFISSVMGMVGEVGKTLYSISKGALISASRSMALELAAKNIRVNCISPGVVESPMSKNAVYNRHEEARKKIKAIHPLGLGQPEDVANASVYLLSDAARWVTGTNLVVDGGYTAR